MKKKEKKEKVGHRKRTRKSRPGRATHCASRCACLSKMCQWGRCTAKLTAAASATSAVTTGMKTVTALVGTPEFHAKRSLTPATKTSGAGGRSGLTPRPGILMDGRLMVVVSEGDAGKATERQLREQKKRFKKTITIRDGARTLRLYDAFGCKRRDGTKLGPGLRLLDDGEIVKAPKRLNAGLGLTFRNGCAPGEAKLVRPPDWLVHQVSVRTARLFRVWRCPRRGCANPARPR